ncbi:outer membrane protein [Helicobacter cetorum]|uniref:outer membrane protein n=1 Tax=Helicobacter cetorum TaxID=138563 RepID=UPI000CF08C0C|nr:outer membrane protein [Helicobacter cetorum]
MIWCNTSKQVFKKQTCFLQVVCFLGVMLGVLCQFLGAKNLSYMASSYQVGMVFVRSLNANKLLQGADILLGYEVNPKNDWAYSRYYIFVDYGNVLFANNSTLQANMFTYGVGGDFMVAYNKNPINRWAFFFGLQLAANTWIMNHKVQNLIVNTWDSIKDFHFTNTYFRAIGQFGVQFRTIILHHDFDVELGMKIFLTPESRSAFERSFLFFVSHSWHF